MGSVPLSPVHRPEFKQKCGIKHRLLRILNILSITDFCSPAATRTQCRTPLQLLVTNEHFDIYLIFRFRPPGSVFLPSCLIVILSYKLQCFHEV